MIRVSGFNFSSPDIDLPSLKGEFILPESSKSRIVLKLIMLSLIVYGAPNLTNEYNQPINFFGGVPLFWGTK